MRDEPGSLAEFADRLRRLRLGAGMPSTRAIAARTGVSHDTVHRVFQCDRTNRTPRWESLHEILTALEVTDTGPWREAWIALHERPAQAGGHTGHPTRPIHPTELTWPRMARSTYERLARVAVRRVFPADSVLVRQGETSEVVHLLESGVAKQFLSSVNGAEQLHDVLVSGRFIGLEGTSLYTVRAAAECLTLSIPGTSFRLAAREPEVADAVHHELMTQLRWQAFRLQELRANPVEQAVAGAVSALAERVGEQVADAVRLPGSLTQRELASLTFVSRTAIERALKSLSRKGLVSVRYRSLEVKDLAALRQLALAPEHPSADGGVPTP
ncbi:helix-turn-helix domain-containing protein [Crossiella sp. SN42]|uniref:helix-turn-helix domain-containing protein n=1 Tax=Crossiella sp. SN42 TaxID=2944808 RepID=UPI00207D4394|nr:helix-turn-helix domain-containing protein [Crossiella sp. SN42]MCO1578519.1 helix-turn-helix domain-containing protein [Crossiella sp. SN42]